MGTSIRQGARRARARSTTLLSSWMLEMRVPAKAEGSRDGGEIGRVEIDAVGSDAAALFAHADQAEAAVAKHDNQDRQRQLADECEIVEHHQHSTVADHGEHGLVGISELGGDRGGDAESHAGKSVGHEECARLIAAPELAHGEFMGSDVAGRRCRRGKNRAQRFDGTKRR